MPIQNFQRVLFGWHRIPDSVGVNDDARTQFTRVQAAGIIGAHLTLQTPLLDLQLKQFPKILRASGGATPFGIIGWAFVDADKNMVAISNACLRRQRI